MYELIICKKIGSIKSVRVNLGSYVPDWHQYESFYDLYACQKKLGWGGITTECYELNTLLDLFGFPEKVYSSTNKRRKFDISAEDSSSILMKHKDFCITVNLCFMQKMQGRNFTIIGTDGYIKLDLVNQSIYPL